MDKNQPIFSLECEVLVAAPAAAVFAFHSDPQNLLTITPPTYQLKLLQAPDALAAGSLVIFEIALLGSLMLPWLSRITEFNPPESFTDTQEWGPFWQYQHTHRFLAVQGQTLLRDTILYTPPLGWPGIALEPLIRNRLEALFRYRHQRTQEHFSPG